MADCSRPARRRADEKPKGSFKGFLYQTPRWRASRRAVAKVKSHAEELFVGVWFIMTNAETPNRAVVRFYNKRRTAEQPIKEGKQATKMTRLSCHRFRSNQMRLQLSLRASDLGNLSRWLALPKQIENGWLMESAATTGEDRRKAGEECPPPWLLLAQGHLTLCSGSSGQKPGEEGERKITATAAKKDE